MITVKHISSRAEIPAGQAFVLVVYRENARQSADTLGFTITVPHNASMAINDLSFTAAIHSAKEIAKRERIATVYACKSRLCNRLACSICVDADRPDRAAQIRTFKHPMKTAMCPMEQDGKHFILAERIRHFRLKLAETTDEPQRHIILRQIEALEEEAKNALKG